MRFGDARKGGVDKIAIGREIKVAKSVEHDFRSHWNPCTSHILKADPVYTAVDLKYSEKLLISFTVNSFRNRRFP